MTKEEASERIFDMLEHRFARPYATYEDYEGDFMALVYAATFLMAVGKGKRGD